MKNFILLLIFFSFNPAWPAGISDLPGIIPKGFVRPPATDLFYNGQILLPHEATLLHQQGIDLANINPKESDIWKNHFLAEIPIAKFAELNEEQNFQFLTSIISRSGNFRFSAMVETPTGMKTYTLMLSKSVHNNLLRKNLLQKIGYRVPQIDYLKKIKLSFNSPFEKEIFTNKLAEDTFGDPKRWIVQDDQEKEMTIQDVIIMESNSSIYNLALGAIPDTVIKGRRVLNSLLIPYSLLHIPESVNLFSWQGGTLISNAVALNFEGSENFNTSYEDARWILNRIAKLTRDDFSEIVEKSYYPKEVEKLVVEKLIARRNSLIDLFDLKITPKIPFDAKISLLPHLEKGKLKKEVWEGHASRYSFGDPASPLSKSELWAFFKSKGLTNLLSNLVGQFNLFALPQFELQDALIDRQTDIINGLIQQYYLTGEVNYMPVALYAMPIYNTNLIASREIIAGSYQGADNIVQLADSIGFNMSLGVYLGTDLIMAPLSLSAQTTASVTRRYTHLRPIKSMKKALKEPFKNILIPLLKRKIGHLFDPVFNGEIEQIEDETQREKKLVEILDSFKEELEVGESIMITDTLGGETKLRGGYRYHEYLRADAAVKAEALVLSRLHILRSSETEIQLIKDNGLLGAVSFSFAVNSAIPVLNVGLKAQRGRANTELFKLDINENEKMNPDIFKNINALREALIHNSLELAESFMEPYRLEHKFGQQGFDLSFLLWRYKKLSTKDVLKMYHPEGGEKCLYRDSSGSRSGVNYETFVTDVLNGLLREAGGPDGVVINSSTSGGGNPGDTLYGKSFTQQIGFEGELETSSANCNDGIIKRPFLVLTNIWKGWSIDVKKAQKIIDELNQKYSFSFYADTVFNQTKKLELYSIIYNLIFYSSAVESMAQISTHQLRDILNSHGQIKVKPEGKQKPEQAKRSKIIEMIKIYSTIQKRYLKSVEDGNFKQQGKFAKDMAQFVESVFDLDGITKMVGGRKNMYITSKVQGFRVGDENGDNPFIAHSIGEIGDKMYYGPWNSYRSEMGLSDSEFFAFWMMDRL